MAEKLAPDVLNYLEKDASIKDRQLPIPEKLSLPRIEDVNPELIDIAENVASISSTWNPVRIFTADSDSINREKASFLEAFDNGQSYNPQFTYSFAERFELDDSKERLKEQLQQLRKKKLSGRIDRLFRGALYFKIKDDLATVDMVEGLQSKDEGKILRAFKRKYPGTDQAIIEAATNAYNNLLSGKTESITPDNVAGYPLSSEEQDFLTKKEFTDKEIAKAFEWALNEYGILRSDENPRGFQVKIDRETTSVDVRDKSDDGPTVFIPEGRKSKADSVLELIAHEIEGHARQSVNGERLFMVGGGRLKVDNEMLYEGLGKRYDEKFRRKFFGTSSGEPLPYYTFAIQSAETGSSFYEIFSEQMDLRLRARLKLSLDQPIPDREHIDLSIITAIKNNSWLTTYRVMRGHIDTSNNEEFSMAKDLSYLRGWLVDRQLQENDLGFLNEAGVIASGGLQLLAELHLSNVNLPLPYKDVVTKYWETELKPQMSVS